MKKGKFKIIMLLILLLLMLSIWIINFKIAGYKANNLQMLENSDSRKDEIYHIENIVKEILSSAEKDFDESLTDSIFLVYKNSGELRDPFVFVQSKKASTPKKKVIKTKQKSRPSPKPKDIQPKLELNGIIFDKENSIAIINGEVYKEGDLIKSYRVVRITKDGVKLVSRNNQIYLKAPEFD